MPGKTSQRVPTRRRLSGPLFPCLVMGLLLTGDAAPAQAAPPAARPERPSPLRLRELPQRILQELREREIVKMLSAIASGSKMGPSEGWFKPGQGRYSWKWLAGRFDSDGDGRISRKELPGPTLFFERLDRDGSGAITAADLDWSDRSPYVRKNMMVSGWFNRIDTGSNGRVTREEWEEFFRRAAQGKDHLTPEDLSDALLKRPPRPRGTPKESGPSPAVLIAGLLNGELGSFFEGPDIGARAPNFTLKTHDGKRALSLRDYRGKKPVVLIFGSFT